MKHTLKPVLGGLGLAITLILGMPAAAQAQSSPSSPNSSSSPGGSNAVGARAQFTTQQSTGYWTAARMKSAQSADNLPGLAQAATTHQRQVAAAKKSAQAQASSRQVAAKQGAAKPVKIDPIQPRTANQSAMAWPSTSPIARTNGKVYFTDANNGKNYVCSGTVVNSEGRDTVWTAGHCVHGGGGGTWHRNWIFKPAYHYGATPYGVWSAAQLWTTSQWAGSSDFSNDVGAVYMNTLNGQHIADVLGGQGIAFNYSKYYWADAFGYPAAAPYNGEELVSCSGNAAPEWSFLWWSATTLKLSCNLTGGSSGGPWLRWFDGSWGWINGVNSYKYNNDPNSMYSPYFDGPEEALFAAVRYL